MHDRMSDNMRMKRHVLLLISILMFMSGFQSGTHVRLELTENELDSVVHALQTGGSSISALEKQSIVTQGEKMLEERPSSGTNKDVIGHAFPAGVSIGVIPYMGTVVIKSEGLGMV